MGDATLWGLIEAISSPAHFRRQQPERPLSAKKPSLAVELRVE